MPVEIESEELGKTQVEDTSRGSTVSTQYEHRRLVAHPIYETEIENLSLLTSEERFYWAACTWVLGIATASSWDLLNLAEGQKVTRQQQVFLWACVLAILASALRAFLLSMKKRRVVAGIIPTRELPILYRAFLRLRSGLERLLCGKQTKTQGKKAE